MRPAWNWLLVVIACVVTEATAEPIPAPPASPPPRDRFALRVGFLHSWLADSNQGRPFFYLDFGLRLKTATNYIDLKLPAFVAGLDYVSFSVQRLVGVARPFNLFEAANKPIQYGAFLEPAHLRLGQTFPLRFPAAAPLRLTAGIFTLFDFVFFDLVRAEEDPAEFRPRAGNATDPYTLAVGGFVAMSGDLPLSEWDLALGVGPDIYQDDGFVPVTGFVIYGDLDVQIDPLADVGTYLRARVSTYTHVPMRVWTVVLTYGVTLPLL